MTASDVVHARWSAFSCRLCLPADINTAAAAANSFSLTDSFVHRLTTSPFVGQPIILARAPESFKRPLLSVDVSVTLRVGNFDAKYLETKAIWVVRVQ